MRIFAAPVSIKRMRSATTLRRELREGERVRSTPCACIAKRESISCSAYISGERNIPAAFWTRYCAVRTRRRASRKKANTAAEAGLRRKALPGSAWRKGRSPRINPRENRFDIEAIVGCELYTKNGVRLGKIVQVLPAETDIYIVARDGKEMRLPAEEGIILDMNVERKRMTVDAERVFELLKEE